MSNPILISPAKLQRLTGGVLKSMFAHSNLYAGTALAFLGTAFLVGAFGNNLLSDQADPIFGLFFHNLMLLIGGVEIAISFILLFTNRKSLGLGLAAWVSANLLTYRVGLWTMGWRHSSGFTIEPLGFSLRATDEMTIVFSTLLLIGSCAVLWAERGRFQSIEFPKMSCPTCGVHIRFAVENLGQDIACPKCRSTVTLRKPEENLKMSCFFCQEHIEFAPHSIGEKIKCPHCKKDISLKEPAMICSNEHQR
jgi:hypothetical protein